MLRLKEEVSHFMSAQTPSRRPSPSFVIITLLVSLLAVAAVLFLLHAMVIPPRDTVDPYPFDTSETTALDTDATFPTTTELQSPETTAPAQPEITDTTAEPDVTAEPPPKVIVLPETDTPVGDDYFTSILFIGDSRTQGLQIATGGYGASFYADRGLSIEGVSSKQFINRTTPTGQTTAISIIEALTEEPVGEKIYIWLGLNELGWRSTDKFENSFRTQLIAIREVCPDAEIVIMALLPVGQNAVVIGVDSNDDANRRVAEYNDILLRLAEEVGVYYLNCYEAFADENGYLPDGYANDGIHLRKEQNLALCDYIRSHPIPAQ